jgi:hypothetical protein
MTERKRHAYFNTVMQIVWNFVIWNHRTKFFLKTQNSWKIQIAQINTFFVFSPKLSNFSTGRCLKNVQTIFTFEFLCIVEFEKRKIYKTPCWTIASCNNCIVQESAFSRSIPFFQIGWKLKKLQIVKLFAFDGHLEFLCDFELLSQQAKLGGNFKSCKNFWKLFFVIFLSQRWCYLAIFSYFKSFSMSWPIMTHVLDQLLAFLQQIFLKWSLKI